MTLSLREWYNTSDRHSIFYFEFAQRNMARQSMNNNLFLLFMTRCKHCYFSQCWIFAWRFMVGTITAFISMSIPELFSPGQSYQLLLWGKQLPDNLLFQLLIDPAAKLSVHPCINRQNKNQYLIVKCFKKRKKETKRLCVNYLRIWERNKMLFFFLSIF